MKSKSIHASSFVEPAGLNVRDAAHYIGIKRSMLYVLAGEGKIKSILVKSAKGNVSGRRVFLRASLDEFLASADAGSIGGARKFKKPKPLSQQCSGDGEGHQQQAKRIEGKK